MHRGELELPNWSGKEKQHLAEVRKMTDQLFFIALFALASFILVFERKRTSSYALANTAIIILFLAVLPFFAYFWRHIFHPLLTEVSGDEHE